MRCKDDDTCDQPATKADVEQAVNDLAFWGLIGVALVGFVVVLPWLAIGTTEYELPDGWK